MYTCNISIEDDKLATLMVLALNETEFNSVATMSSIPIS